MTSVRLVLDPGEDFIGRRHGGVGRESSGQRLRDRKSQDSFTGAIRILLGLPLDTGTRSGHLRRDGTYIPLQREAKVQVGGWGPGKANDIPSGDQIWSYHLKPVASGMDRG